MDKLTITVFPCPTMAGPAQIIIDYSNPNDLDVLLKLEKEIDDNIVVENKLISKRFNANHTIVVWSFNGDINNLYDIINQKRLAVTNALIRELR